MNRNLRNRLARRLATRTDALLLASATPHNGDARSFAELIEMLDPAAIADDRNYSAKDIDHLYIRRTKISTEVTNEMGGKWRGARSLPAIHCPAYPGRGRDLRGADPGVAGRARHAPGAGRDAAYSPTRCSRCSSPATRPWRSPRASALSTPGDETETRRAHPPGRARRRRSPTPTRPSSPPWSRKLTEIGVGPHSATRAVVFSESVPTLEVAAPGPAESARAG